MVNVVKTKDKFIRAAREQRHTYREMMIRTRLTFHKKRWSQGKKTPVHLEFHIQQKYSSKMKAEKKMEADK